ncbi:unnamed protein product, partial [Rotaria sordida]
MVGSSNQVNEWQSMELVVQNISFDSTKHGIESSPNSACVLGNINEYDNSSSHHDLTNMGSSTPSINNILSCIKQTSTCEQDKSFEGFSPAQLNGNESHSETTTDNESEKNEFESDVDCTPLSIPNIGNITPAHSLVAFNHIEGVKFITTQELNFIDAQREKYPSIQWFTEDKQKKVKPSRHWFSKDHLWLRAVCSNGIYGLLCVDCGEFATNKTLIERSNGAFI